MELDKQNVSKILDLLGAHEAYHTAAASAKIGFADFSHDENTAMFFKQTQELIILMANKLDILSYKHTFSVFTAGENSGTVTVTNNSIDPDYMFSLITTTTNEDPGTLITVWYFRDMDYGIVLTVVSEIVGITSTFTPGNSKSELGNIQFGRRTNYGIK